MPGHILPHSHGESMNTEHILHVISQTDNFQTVAESFKILGDPTRIRIFWMLCHCEECVINISAMMDMSSPAVSHHLRQLKNAGLIVSRREGKEVYYKAADRTEPTAAYYDRTSIKNHLSGELIAVPGFSIFISFLFDF